MELIDTDENSVYFIFPLSLHVHVSYLSFYRRESQLSFDGNNLDSGTTGCVSLVKSLDFSGSVS